MKRLILILALVAGVAGAQTVSLSPVPKQQFLDNSGNPLNGGKLYSYIGGTSTPLATYTDSTGGSANTNPVILDSAGRANVWLLNQPYKLVLKTSADVTIWTVDNVTTISTTISPRTANNKQMCDAFPGADAEIKISACLTATAAGGIADAQGIYGAQSGTATITVAANKTLLLGGMHYTSTANPPFTVTTGAVLRGLQKDTTRVTWSADGPAVSVNGASAYRISDILFTPTGSGANVKGISVLNAGAPNQWSYIHDIRCAAPSLVVGQYCVWLRSTVAQAQYWHTVERIQATNMDWTLVAQGDSVSTGAVVNGNFFRDIVGTAGTGNVLLIAAGDNYVTTGFHSLSGGPASTTGIKFGDGTVAGAASNNIWTHISDAGSSAVPYNITANSKANYGTAVVQGGTPVRGTAGDGNMTFESTFAGGVKLYWDDLVLYRTSASDLGLDNGVTIGASAGSQDAFTRTSATGTHFAEASFVTGDAANRYQRDILGEMKWGGGAGAADWGVKYVAAGRGRITDASTGYGNLEMGLMHTYNGIATVAGGVPAIYATVDLTAQTAAVTTTTLYAVPASGEGQYRVSWSAKVTTAATTGAATSTLGALTIVYTDPDGVVQTITMPASVAAGTIATSSTGNTTTTVLLGVPLLLNAKLSTNITYAFSYASDTASEMQYNLHIKLEKL